MNQTSVASRTTSNRPALDRKVRKRSLWSAAASAFLAVAFLAATVPTGASTTLAMGEMGTLGAGTLSGEQYRLKLHHLHSGESIDLVYRIGDTYLPAAMVRLNYFLRDSRTQDQSRYDPREFDLLHNLLGRLGRPNAVVDIVCGYRTPWSNNFLRTRSANTGVAKNSQHTLAKAIDIRVPGITTRKLRDAALSLQAGGVGYYPVSRFVHVDVGPVRRWSFAGRGDD
ncbi:MAG: DUF882 domain-containing protein [Acidobacteriaceae bacterium]